jgi:fucose permease
VPLGQALRDGAQNRRLWLWLFGAALCTLLDEIVVALTTLHLSRDLRVPQAHAAGYAAALSLGGVIGAFIAERALARMSSTRVLVSCAGVCTLGLGVLLALDSVRWMLPVLLVVGMSAAPQYALLQARAFAAVPGRPGVVNALSEVFVVLDILAPVALGVIADRFGLELALDCLLMQPLCVLGLVLLCREHPRRPRRLRGTGLDRRDE